MGLSTIPRSHERDHVGGTRVSGKICTAGDGNSGMENLFGSTVKSTFCYESKKRRIREHERRIPAPCVGAAIGHLCDRRLVMVGGEGQPSAAFDRGGVWSPQLDRKNEMSDGQPVGQKSLGDVDDCGDGRYARGNGSHGDNDDANDDCGNDDCGENDDDENVVAEVMATSCSHHM